MTPPTRLPKPGGIVNTNTYIYILYPWQSSNLIGGVMTPPYNWV